jgi:hypothetical protein
MYGKLFPPINIRRPAWLYITPFVLVAIFLVICAVVHQYHPLDVRNLQYKCTDASLARRSCLNYVMMAILGVADPYSSWITQSIVWLVITSMIAPLFAGLIAAVNVKQPFLHFISAFYIWSEAALLFFFTSFLLILSVLQNDETWVAVYFFLAAAVLIVEIATSGSLLKAAQKRSGGSTHGEE